MPKVYPQRIYAIYGLVDPRTHKVRYVGYAANPPKRYKRHYAPGDLEADTVKNRWLKGLLRRGLRARMIILAECQDAEVGAYEQDYIAAYKARGYKLTNGTEGGQGSLGSKQSPETRALKSRILSGKKRTPEQRARMSQAQKDRNVPSEVMSAIAACNKGKKRTPEQLAEASRRAKARGPLSTEHMEKMRLARIGIPHSPEHRAAIAAAGRGRKHTPETRAKMRAAALGRPAPNKGKKLTPEERAVISAGQYRAWENRRKAQDAVSRDISGGDGGHHDPTTRGTRGRAERDSDASVPIQYPLPFPDESA